MQHSGPANSLAAPGPHNSQREFALDDIWMPCSKCICGFHFITQSSYTTRMLVELWLVYKTQVLELGKGLTITHCGPHQAFIHQIYKCRTFYVIEIKIGVNGLFSSEILKPTISISHCKNVLAVSHHSQTYLLFNDNYQQQLTCHLAFGTPRCQQHQ